MSTRRSTFAEPLEPRTMMASTISGIVYNDQDSDGRRELGEPRLANVRVYIDLNFDGKFQSSEASRLTNSKGEYTFSNVPAGIFRVRVVVPAERRQTSPGKLFYDIPANGADIHAANDFGITSTAVVRGKVFNDNNGDGIRQQTEQGLAGFRVYVDKNNNGKFDAGEKSRVTDAQGNWRLAGISPGRVRIRIVKPSAIEVTTPSRGFFLLDLVKGQQLANRNFGLA